MRKLILVGIFILGVGLVYAYAENKAVTEIEHQYKTVIGTDGDMSTLKSVDRYAYN